MADEKPEKTEAEKALEALEAPHHRAKHAQHNLDTLERMVVPQHEPTMVKLHAELVEKAKAEVVEAAKAEAAHEAAHGGHRQLVKKINKLSQKVLDEREEGHTEEAIDNTGNAERDAPAQAEAEAADLAKLAKEQGDE